MPWPDRRICSSGWVPAGISDRKSTRLNSSHVSTSYADFCLKDKNSDGALLGDADSQNDATGLRLRPLVGADDAAPGSEGPPPRVVPRTRPHTPQWTTRSRRK